MGEVKINKAQMKMKRTRKKKYIYKRNEVRGTEEN